MPHAATRPKNVLLIVVDQWRADCLSYLGHPCLRTPNLDALCADGVTFRNHFTQAVPCGPGRASLHTGLYMMNHRVVQNSVPMDGRHTNLALEMRRAGYEPGLVGYTTTTPDPRVTPPEDPRFKNLGALMPGWYPVGPWEPEKAHYFNWLRAHGFPLPEAPEDIWLPADGPGAGPTRSPSRVPTELSDSAWATECALTYLRGVRGRPWCLHLGYYRPHPPFIASAPYHTRYDPADVPPPVRAASPEAEGLQHPLLAYYMGAIKQSKFFRDGHGLGSAMTEDQVRTMRAAYYGLITEVDDYVGRVLAFLRETGQYDDTLIVLTCDHGEQLGDHHLLGKLGYFDESFRIPLIVRDPSPEARASRGRIVDAFTETIDVLPTILEWVGQPVPRPCDGASLRPFLQRRDAGGVAAGGALRVRLPQLLQRRARAPARPARRPVLAGGDPGRPVQVRALRRAAAALLRPRSRSRSAREPRARPGACRARAGVRAEDAELAPAPRRPHAHRLERLPRGAVDRSAA